MQQNGWTYRGYYELSQVSKTKKEKYYDFTCIWNPKNKTNEQTKRRRIRPINTENKLMGVRREVGGGDGQDR